MSLWSDIQARSAGEIKRKEDEYQNNQESSDLLSQPITFVGNIDKQSIPSAPKGGQIFYTNDVITINGIEYPSGCMLLYDGNTWYNMGDYLHQRVDANIGYYMPDTVQETSIETSII